MRVERPPRARATRARGGPGREASAAVAAVALGACLVAVAFAPAALAGSDPWLEWFTLDTPHFRIHYPEGLEPLAQRTAVAAEQAHEALSDVFGWAPSGPTEVLVSDFDDSANGFANVRPFARITLLAHPPPAASALAHHGDYWRLLVFHEYAHVLHFDQVSGLPAAVNAAFGRAFFPHQSLPTWLVEGLAVWAETAFTDQGRNHRGFFEVYLRTAALEGVLPTLAQIGGQPLWPPRGEMLYAMGGAFVAWLVDRHGEEALRRFLRRYGSRLVGFGLNTAAREAFGDSFDALHDAFRAELHAQAEAWAARRRAEGLVEGEALTTEGENHSLFRVSPDGRWLLYQRGTGRDPTELRLLDLRTRTERVIVTCWGGCTAPSWAPDSRTFYYAKPTWTRTFYRYHDLFRVDARTGDEVAITSGRRAQAPAVSPDGERLVYTASSGGGRVDLWLRDLASGEERRLVRSGRTFRQPSDARWSPDGRRLVFTMTAEGTRDLWLYDLDEGATWPLMRDDALDLAPVFSADGRWILFASEREGAFDLFAIDADAEAPDRARRPLWRVTRVSSAALDPEPSPAEGALYYRRWSHRGWDLGRLALDPSRFEPAGILDATRADVPLETLPAPPRAAWVAERSYDPVPTMIPRAWLPDFRVVGRDVSGQAELSGADIAGFHHYSLRAEFSSAASTPTVAARYVNDRMVPTLASDLFWYRDTTRGALGFERFDVKRDVVTTGFSATLPFNDDWKRHTFTARVDSVLLLPHVSGRYAFDPTGPPPSVPRSSVRLIYALSWRHTSSRTFSWSISRERGRDLGVTMALETPILGSDTTHWTLRWDWSEYISLGASHVLALRYDGGVSGSPDLSGRRFRVGGVPPRPLLEDILQRRGLGAGLLRGFAPGAFTGDVQHLFTTEWRFPLAYVHRGAGSLPFFVQRVHGAVFCDAGVITSEALSAAPWHAGFGIELRADLDLLYGRGVGLRLGFAHGLGDEGQASFYLVAGRGF